VNTPRTQTAAELANRHELYEQATQQPELAIGFIEDLAERLELPAPLSLREDFCGTAYLASMWVASHPERRATGVDIDASVLAYAEQHHRVPLGAAADRLTLHEANVTDCLESADVVVALNFSTFIYKTPATLRHYLQHTYERLSDNGFLVIDAYGGPGAWTTGADTRHVGTFDYIWDQASVDVETNGAVNHIHFRFEDESELNKAFTYDWRLWTLAELTEAAEDVGFEVGIWFEAEDGFVDGEELAEQDAFVAYLVAAK
jgi:cyclopropane fatty-acyl-phospholipid synthase-like methyltransferase